MTQYAADLHSIREAATRIDGTARRTPVITCGAIDEMAGRSLFFKCENLQKVGAFKFRGAFNAISRLSDDETQRGVVTHSSGNHAQALALAAKLRGIAAHIVMPRDAPAVKRAAVEGYGGRVIPCEPTLPARDETAARVQSETGAVFIPPYDHPDIIAGQGTAALELLEQVDDLDAVIAPVGGGGLLSGVCIAARGLSPSIRIFGAEPAGADDAARSFREGRFIPQHDPRTIADGLKTSLGELTWPIIRDHVESIITVEEAEIVAAMRTFWERAKLVIEPSAAVAVAVALSAGFRQTPGCRRVGIVLSGGNVNLDALPWMNPS